jgi:magnesium chelatase family protein
VDRPGHTQLGPAEEIVAVEELERLLEVLPEDLRLTVLLKLEGYALDGLFHGLVRIPHSCGYRSDPRRACSCSPPRVEKYLSRISGPLLDRIDLYVEVPAVPFTQLAEMPPGPTSADLRAQVLEARARQAKRFGPKGAHVNGRMTPRQVRKYCALKPEAMSLLKAAMEDLGLSARAHDKFLRVARTIADLEGHDDIKPQNIAEAVGYRSLDRSLWA